MNYLSRVAAAGVSTVYGGRPTALPSPIWEAWPPAQLYNLYRNYYYSVDLYSQVQRSLYERGVWRQGMKPLRNPSTRVVEFYASTLWPGPLDEALRIETDNQAIVDPITQVWAWSNWSAKKQLAAREFAMTGDLFIRVAVKDDRSRVFFTVLRPEDVTDFDVDERGVIVWCRTDTPVEERRGDTRSAFTRTEVWSKADDRYRRWTHERGSGAELAQLGSPEVDAPLTSFGIDFIPLVHAPFRDVGQTRGLPPIATALDKIDDANLSVTRLHQMLFRHNNVTHVLRANGMDATGRPLPPPSVAGMPANTTVDPNVLTVGDESFYRLPGTAELQQLVPQLNYADALAILQDDMVELRHDLPELIYDDLPAWSDASGVAVRLRMSAAIDRIKEARGNGLGALERADMMALTMGKTAGLFPGIGTFENGDYEHTLTPPPVVPLSETEIDAARATRAQIAGALADLLPDRERITLVFPEWDAERVDEVMRQIEERAASNPLAGVDGELARLARLGATTAAVGPDSGRVPTQAAT